MMKYGRKRVDIKIQPLTTSFWQPDEWPSNILALYQRTESEICDAIGWYLREKRLQARWSRLLRLSAILLAVAGGLVPLVHAANPDLIASEWGYVLLAAAAGCALLDRFFGFSGSWMRYMRTQFALQRTLTNFQHAWTASLARQAHRQPSEAERDSLLKLIRDASVQTRELIEAETEAWISELSSQLDNLNRTIGEGLIRHPSADR